MPIDGIPGRSLVTRRVDSAVRYALRGTLDRDADRLTIRVEGLTYRPGGPPPAPPAVAMPAVSLADLRDSTTDVA